MRSKTSGGTQFGSLEWIRHGRRMKRIRSARERTGRTSSDTPPHATDRMAKTVIDLFEKTRTHERLELLRAARENDLMPYFRLLEGEAGPVVEMEGAERVMLGSNNYLGLTRDPRVKEAARAALEQYGTALTGSRFLNGTIAARTSSSSTSWRTGWATRTRSSSRRATRPTWARSPRCSRPPTP